MRPPPESKAFRPYFGVRGSKAWERSRPSMWVLFSAGCVLVFAILLLYGGHRLPGALMLTVSAAAGAAAVLLDRGGAREGAIEHGACRRCGYDLSRFGGTRCPECGFADPRVRLWGRGSGRGPSQRL
jgi:hypothetical protein